MIVLPCWLSQKIILVDWGDFTSEHITCLPKLAVSQPNPNTASQIFFGTFPNWFWNHPAGSCTHTTLTQFISWYQYMKVVFSKYSSEYTPCCPEPKGRCLQYVDGALLDLSEQGVCKKNSDTWCCFLRLRPQKAPPSCLFQKSLPN